jgi:anaerobic magnesium-protoporphyrin IX monomethyl ester cyclase
LVSPPYNSDVKSVVGVSSPPVGLAYLASALGSEHEVKILDANVLGYGMDDVRRALKDFYPDVVGITSVTPSIPQAYHVARIAKEVRGDCKVLVGGPHATFLPRKTLEECSFIDVVVRGEGEETIRELVDAFENGGVENVRGVTFRRGDEIVSSQARPCVKDIDAIPLPSWHLLPMDKYRFYGERYAAMLSSRGCPFGCSFCASSRLFGGFWRGRSPENVLEEIKMLHEGYGIRNIEFVDDTFTLDQKRAERICEEIVREGLDISWGASSRVDTLSRRLVEKMKRAGCWILFLGIESGCQKILDVIGKKITVEQARKAVKIVKGAGMKVLGSFIIGFPEDDEESVKQTINFAKSLDLDYAEFSILTPYPGTPVFEDAVSNNLLVTWDWSKYTGLEPVMKVKGLNGRRVKTLLQEAYLNFYLTPKTLWSWLRNGQLMFVKAALKALAGYLKFGWSAKRVEG